MNNIFKKAIQLIDKSQVIAIASHIGPDGDNIGSIMAIGKYLKASCHSAECVLTLDNGKQQLRRAAVQFPYATGKIGQPRLVEPTI